MDTKSILQFLKDIAANNNRPWFLAHKAEYDAVRKDFEEGVAQLIARIATFDDTVAHLSVKDCTYRFNRDTRFSPDKSPYKRHLGAYVSAKGKKSLHGGYYIHLEPDSCLVACGSYWLPTNILTSCRNELMANEEEWLRCVERADFLKYYGAGEEASWDSKQGFGMERLKTCPSGFPKDYAHMRYLRQKDYCCWHHVSDNFFDGSKWIDKVEPMFKAAKPMMDFMNAVIDDYE
ncbi:MAG: DUF2461 domain-containing protein [Prevotella sp.]|nr:DUF2461 domain-containing protein [Prevotella sp.]MBQ9203883.1 DUF2461 domain-containing protein [Prevotella sp.]